MGLFSYLFPDYFKEASDFDRTNINDGVYQARAGLSSILNGGSAIYHGKEFPAVVLHVAGPTKEPNYFEMASILEASTKNTSKLQQYYKIHFRVISDGLHDNLPLPSSFQYLKNPATGDKEVITTSEARVSPLTPEAQEELLISCHPSFYVSSEKLQSVVPNPGDGIRVTFRDPSFSNAIYLGLEEKGLNNIRKPTVSAPPTVPEAFEATPAPKKMSDLKTLNFKKTKYESGNCQGSEDGSLAALAKEIGFLDPYVLVALRMKESAGDPTAFRFEPHVFLGQGSNNSKNPRNETRYIKNNAATYGYKLTSIYVVDNAGKVSKKYWYIPQDATYNPESNLTYLEQIKPHLDDPNGAVQTKGGIRYAPRKGFFALGPKTTATYKGKEVVAYAQAKGYTASTNDNEELHIRDAAFMKAYNFDPTRAIKSTSWGKYQVMGWALLRVYDNNPQTALDAFLEDPVTVGDLMLKGFFSRFDKKPAMDAVNSDYPNPPSPESWLTFAKLYNGPRCCGGGSKVYDKSIAKKYLSAKQKCDIKPAPNSSKVA